MSLLWRNRRGLPVRNESRPALSRAVGHVCLSGSHREPALCLDPGGYDERADGGTELDRRTWIVAFAAAPSARVFREEGVNRGRTFSQPARMSGSEAFAGRELTASVGRHFKNGTRGGAFCLGPADRGGLQSNSDATASSMAGSFVLRMPPVAGWPPCLVWT